MVLRDEVQLSAALKVFSQAHSMPMGWTARIMMHLRTADITSIDDLASRCKHGSINSELKLYGAPKEDILDETTIQSLKAFLPGLFGFRCFRLAQRIAEKVAKGSAESEYIHRPENGSSKGDEKWHVPLTGNWIANVDCAGFVRNTIEHFTKQPFVMSLSDRDFMRAKDFYCFFSKLPFTVMDPPSPKISAASNQHRVTNWRIVNDLRMVIPGDILVYRSEGGAAGGAAFTTADRQDIRHLLQAVKTAELWIAAQLNGDLVTQHNVAKEPPVHEWVEKVKSDLAAVGIVTLKGLYDGLNTIQLRLKEKGLHALNKEILDLMKQCYEATSEDTGHIVFVSGPAVNQGNDEYRVRVVHSTKYGNKNENGQVTTGVQEHYRRFVLKKEEHAVEYWTRKQTAVRDEVAGQANVEVLAARMCF